MTADDPHTKRQARAAIHAYANGEISREVMLDRLVEVATPGEWDPTGGDGYRPGMADIISSAVGDDLLNEDDWNAIAEHAKTFPDLMARVMGRFDGVPVREATGPDRHPHRLSSRHT